MIIRRIVLTGLVALFSTFANADSLPGKINNFVSTFNFTDAVVSYDIRKIEAEYPNRLLTPDAMLPQTSKYPLKDIQQLYHLSQTCTGALPLSPLITEPLVFTRTMCKGTKLAKRWFARSALIHPGGGTYAARYIKRYPDKYDALKQYMHIQERPVASEDSLLGRLQRMDGDSITALISGASMFAENGELWLRKGYRYYIFPANVWHYNAKKMGLDHHLVGNADTCFVQRGNLCWAEEDQSEILRYILVGLVAVNLLLIIGWLYYRWNSKKRELKSRMLVLQILTHELRTPIASLSLTVEGFRREFEKLPESVYDEFRRLCEDSRRLRQLAEASKDYLQSDTKPLSTEMVSSISEWLEFKVEEEFDQKVTFSIDKDVSASLNVYWLGTCIDNLLRNALKYGVAPVHLDVETSSDMVTFKVVDQGQLTDKDWRQLRKPFVSKSGLGLGLTIVESMVNRMGGKMTLIGPPTTFILEIPCETDVASR
ncbi:sensor histidine kinase VxrA [Vibrio salinus]|uniref:sensor histidine kinase VxrA n=1 Tax=Vibrio salinus TaxID=2899784 RepID=UPI001E5F1D60|nr:sensor histidine kinase VxrA [Vibrio salinus]MCE0495814.1 sensor histidine kinase [Vibrio salinus]